MALLFLQDAPDTGGSVSEPPPPPPQPEEARPPKRVRQQIDQPPPPPHQPPPPTVPPPPCTHHAAEDHTGTPWPKQQLLYMMPHGNAIVPDAAGWNIEPVLSSMENTLFAESQAMFWSGFRGQIQRDFAARKVTVVHMKTRSKANAGLEVICNACGACMRTNWGRNWSTPEELQESRRLIMSWYGQVVPADAPIQA